MPYRASSGRPRGHIAAFVLAVSAVVGVACGGGDTEESGDAFARGGTLFANNCAACHGPAGVGTANGPPLVHVIYEPSHHPDESFHRAVAEGVVAHHWGFGPMPALPGLDRGEVDDIIAYVRALQREAGIG